MKYIKFLFLTITTSGCLYSCKSGQSNDLKTSQILTDSTNNKKCEEVPRKFLVWYKTHFDELSSIQLINSNENGETYRVNFNQADKYFNILKSSGYLSKNYIDSMRYKFIEYDKKFLVDKQNDGPPYGFEADLILLTQEPEYFFDNIDKLKYETSSKDKSIILSVDNTELVFLLSDDCLIKKITNTPR